MTHGKNNSVLIPHEGGTRGYHCLRSFGKRGFDTILGADGTTPGSVSRYCDETVSLPSTETDLAVYKDALLRVASRSDVRTIVPVWEATAFVLSKYRDEFEEHVDLAVPSLDQLRTVQDRVRLVEAAERAGVPAPETRPVTDVENWDRELIVKSRYNLLTSDYVDSFSRGSGTSDRIEHLRVGERPDVDELVADMDHVPIAQEFVRWRDEYMVGAICDHGRPVATIQLRQIRENSYKGGGGVYRKTTYDPDLDRVARDLLSELDWHGLACLEYMEDAETGEFKLTEINPRIWQSIGPSMRAGQDFPYYYWLVASGAADRIDPEYELGVGSHLLMGEAQHLKSILEDDSPRVEKPNFYATLGEIALSCLAEPRFDVLRFDDPVPFVYGAFSGVRDRLSSTVGADSGVGPIRNSVEYAADSTEE
jgi:predicted ATP-grasp superfamily ATP-dependent carboligase